MTVVAQSIRRKQVPVMTENRSNVIERILAVYDGLPNSERHIADYILEKRSSIAGMTARDIAEASGSSAASMSRFVKSLGYSSFAQLAFTLEHDSSDPNGLANAHSKISLDNLDEAIDFALAVKIEELTATARYLKSSKLSHVVQLIRNAGVTVFAGVGNTISIAQNAAFKLSQTGYRAIAPSTSDGSALMALTLTADDVLVVLSTTGYSKRLVGVMENAHQVGATVVLVSDRVDSELSKRADILLRTATHDRLLTQNLRFSQNPLNFVIELITFFLFNESTDAEVLAQIFDRNMLYDKEITEGESE